MNELEKLKKHITKDVAISLKNSEGVETTFYFKPMKMGEQIVATKIFKTLKKISEKYKDNNGTDLSEDLDEQFTQQTFDLFMKIVKRSFEGIDDETAENFVQTNFDQLFSNIAKLIPNTKSEEELDSLNKAKERITSGQENTK